ncbi:MAG: hypothetical protein IJY82_07050 [Oscillospiraceae bacterium]|nr:hypothetical protein [Oscillospiraceae bacterium]
MKKSIALGLSLFFLLCTACTPAPEEPKKPEGPLTIVFAGDSITDAGRDQEQIAPGMNLGTGYVKMVDDYYKETMGENAPIILNAGTSGNTSEQLMARFRTDVAAHSPDILVVLIGVNDHYNGAHGAPNCTPEDFERRISRMMHDYAYEYYRVVLATPFYIEQPGTPRRNELKAYQDILREIAQEYENTELLDAQAVFDDAVAKPDYSATTYTPDQVHLYEPAAKDLAQAFIRILDIA